MKSASAPMNYEPERERRPQFWRLAMRCAQIAGTVDVIFFFLFHALGSPVLAWINVVSVAMYAGAYYALKYHKNKIAVPRPEDGRFMRYSLSGDTTSRSMP